MEYRQISDLGRIAFLRLKVTMNQFKDYEKTHAGETAPAIFATIDGYEVYADADQKMLMYSRSNSEEQDRAKLRKDGKYLELPQGPLIESAAPEDETAPAASLPVIAPSP